MARHRTDCSSRCGRSDWGPPRRPKSNSWKDRGRASLPLLQRIGTSVEFHDHDSRVVRQHTAGAPHDFIEEATADLLHVACPEMTNRRLDPGDVEELVRTGPGVRDSRGAEDAPDPRRSGG